MTDLRHEVELLRGLPVGLFIDGQWRDASGGATFEVLDPSNGEALAKQVADASPSDGLAALDAAVAVSQAWASTSPRMRSELLRRVFEKVHERQEDFALTMTLEMGKPLADSVGEVAYGAEFFRWFSEEAVRIDGRFTREPGGGGSLLVSSQPVGPALLITPWNFPLAMATRKIGAAIAAGCTMILKPASATPLTAILLVEVMREAGLPDGVLNLVTTTNSSDVTDALLGDSRLRKVSFTGSTAVGRSIAAKAAPNLQRVSMELGGNAPFLVFADADLKAAIAGAVTAKMRNMGEACTAANRFLVHESLAEKFTSGLAAKLEAMTVGRGTEEGVEVGPLIDAAALNKVSELVDDAVNRGAKVVTGGMPLGERGWFYAPTVLADVTPDCRVLHEEVFGPVAPVSTFSNDAEAIDSANATEYGLVAYAYTADLNRALDVADRLSSGMVGINRGVVSNPAAPFGGVNQSGLGREGGAEGIWEYLDLKYVGIAR